MRIGLVGLGRMGGNMTTRLLEHKIEVVAYDVSRARVDEISSKGAKASYSIKEMVSLLTDRVVVWLMIPAGKLVDDSIEMLLPELKKNDIIIDGGNSHWKDSRRRGEYLNKKGIKFIDCGVSGGVWGLKNGYCLMYGGDKEACSYCEPIFKALAPDKGYLYCGENGSGHFVKMVHNGIEYGMMQSYAEGFELLERSPFKIDLAATANVWQYGTVIRSWLLELASNALQNDPHLDKLKGYVDDSGEGRWTVEAALEFEVPANVISTALFNRFRSRQEDSFAMKLLAALRNQFGGHPVKTIE